MVGMWLNCIYGGKGVGMINLLLFLIVGVFVAGQMVGRTPDGASRYVPFSGHQTGADGKPQTSLQPVKDGSDIQSNFFDMWRQEHADADLQDVPGDLVTASGSGLDPHITLANAEFQLDRIAAKWADDTQHDAGDVRKDIEQILQNNVSAPFGGLAGEKLVNVLEVNLELCKRYGLPK
jgi:potassium-transporting ATPase KdpC subunit